MLEEVDSLPLDAHSTELIAFSVRRGSMGLYRDRLRKKVMRMS